MKNFSRLAYMGIPCVLLAGCVASEPQSEELRVIEKSQLTNVKSWQFDDLYKEVRVVALETTEESLFADIEQTICTDSDIFVRAALSSDTNDAAVWQFDRNGRFVRQLGAIGEGPGEYNDISNIILKNDTLFAFDSYNLNVHLYNVKTGEFIHSTPVDEFDPLQKANTILQIPGSSNFLFSSNVFFGDKTFGIAECNPLTSYFKLILPQRFKVSSWTSYQYGYPTLAEYNKDKALALLPLNDTIYSVGYADGSVTPFAVIDMGVTLPEFAPNEEYQTALNQAIENKYINGLKGMYASKDYLILNRESGSIVWNLKEQTGKYTLNGWKEADDNGFPFFPINIVESKSDNTFVCAYDAESFMPYSQTKFNKSVINMPDNINSISEDSNDVLVIYRLK